MKIGHGTLDLQVRQGFGRPLPNGGVLAVQQADQHVSRPRRLKNLRGLATRYEKTATVFQAGRHIRWTSPERGTGNM
ncbi:hypothetical protein GCM10025734_15800 [Kitasatospora paranensis]